MRNKWMYLLVCGFLVLFAGPASAQYGYSTSYTQIQLADGSVVLVPNTSLLAPPSVSTYNYTSYSYGAAPYVGVNSLFLGGRVGYYGGYGLSPGFTVGIGGANFANFGNSAVIIGGRGRRGFR